MIGLPILLSHSPCWTLLSSLSCIVAWNARQISRCFALFCFGANSLLKVVQTPLQTHRLSVKTTSSSQPLHRLLTLTLVKKMPLVPPVISLFQFNSFHTIYKIPNSAFVPYLGITRVVLTNLTIRNFNANFSLCFCFQLFILHFPLFYIAYRLSAWIFINPVRYYN